MKSSCFNDSKTVFTILLITDPYFLVLSEKERKNIFVFIQLIWMYQTNLKL